jgi:hypothetical protein
LDRKEPASAKSPQNRRECSTLLKSGTFGAADGARTSTKDFSPTNRIKQQMKFVAIGSNLVY